MRTKKISIYKIFSILSIIFMTWAIATSLITPRIGKIFSLFRSEHSYKIIIILNIICFIFSILIFLSIIYWTKKKMQSKDLSSKQSVIFILVELVLYSLFLWMFIKLIGFENPVDDTRITLKFLEQFLEQGKQFGYDYMYSNPQNLLLMYFYRVLRLLFGSNYIAIIVAFIFIHCMTILFTFFSLKNLGITNKLSLLAVQVLFFALQVTLHVPVAYTDILSLFFISISVFFFSKFIIRKKFVFKRALDAQSLVYLLFTCIFASLGFLSKGTLLIFIIALSVYLFFTEQKWKKLFILFPFVAVGIFNIGWNRFIQQEQIYKDNNYGQPNTHYIMMGLSNTPIPNNLSLQQKYEWAVGTYNSKDQSYSWKLFLDQRLPKKEIQKKQLEIAHQRWNTLSTFEKIRALNNKVAVTWSSGDLKSSFEWELGVDKENNRLGIFSNKISGLIIYCWMMVIQYIIYLGVILSTMKYFNRENRWIYFSNIFITGYFCFLLIWEASPRYAMGIFIPSILMIGLFLDSEKKQYFLENK
ncbi:hypothetical protein P7D52_00745 [Enterococcus dongliensis]|uniref:hypothetical protein n=1 Tax=Enterococcus dongliensis TaxID=2559925 RepID=UPI0028900352|nr:hypothetical protein [Enterococcus dongliensis]MDT2641340.1 hypothetical protein [Enterococcus dongliensis]MDT2646560.1 hypothetical protein [Enterococcus dongliensis]